MFVVDDRVIYSASDLAAAARCEYALLRSFDARLGRGPAVSAADELLARTDAVVAERVRVSAALRRAGYDLPDSQANFVWLPLGPEHTADFVEQCADGGVLVRPYGTDGVRVTIGAPAENDAFLAIAAQWIAGR